MATNIFEEADKGPSTPQQPASAASATPVAKAVANGNGGGEKQILSEELSVSAKGKGGFPFGSFLVGAVSIYILACLFLGAAGMSYPLSSVTVVFFAGVANLLIEVAQGDAGNLGHILVVLVLVVAGASWLSARARK